MITAEKESPKWRTFISCSLIRILPKALARLLIKLALKNVTLERIRDWKVVPVIELGVVAIYVIVVAVDCPNCALCIVAPVIVVAFILRLDMRQGELGADALVRAFAGI